MLEVGGSPIAISVPDARLALAAARLLIECSSVDTRPVGSLRWMRRSAPPPSRSADLRWPDLAVWREDDLTVYRHDDLVGRVAGTDAEVFGDPADPRLAFRRLFFFLMGHVLAETGGFLVHAATISRDGDTVLALGRSGAGKSTLVAAALAAGWRVLADDLVVLRPNGTRVDAQGIPRPIAVPRDVAGPERAGIPDDERDRVELEPGAHDLGGHHVTHTIVLGHSASAGRLVDGDPTALFHLLVGMCACGHVEEFFRAFFPIAGALGRLPTHRLELDADPERRLSRAAADLDRLQVASVSR